MQVLVLSERTKAIEAVLEVCRLAQELKLDRRSVLVAFGGGVCSDVVGFAASMIRRGIAHIRVPTTLVGQIDAGIGLNTEFAGCLSREQHPWGRRLSPWRCLRCCAYGGVLLWHEPTVRCAAGRPPALGRSFAMRPIERTPDEMASLGCGAWNSVSLIT